MHKTLTADRRLFGPADDGAGNPPAPPAGGDPTPPAAPALPPNPPAPPAGGDPTPPAGDPPPAARWWEDGKRFDADTQKWLAARGLTVDDPMEVLPKIVQGHRNAESRLGKGLDSILDKPAKDQPYGDWARANAEALGLPKDAAGYEVKPPADWPKDLPWDSAAEAAAREIAFKHGVPPEAHQAYVAFQAEQLKQTVAAADRELAAARTEMDADLRKDWGDQLDARKTRATQAMQAIAEKAGMTEAHIQALSQTMSGATSDAAVIRLMDVVAEMMADDSGIGMGRGDKKFGMTPAEARSELARFEGPEGEYGKAFAAGDRVKLAELKPRREQLSKLAAQ